MNLRLTLCLVFLCFSVLLSAQGSTSSRTKYINQFKYMAISEMDRSGIPASITLAQGLLESGDGNSVLASGSNNHFGIKCKNNWYGQTYYHEDDDYDREGKLTESCFRAYPTPEDSYIDHTDFLMSGQRYAFIFQYAKTDYKNWARGLKRAGYATNPKYADMLIKVIEDNNLSQYDYQSSLVIYTPPKVDESTAELIVEAPVATIEQEIPEKEKEKEKAKIPEFHDIEPPETSLFPKRNKKGVFRVNQVKTVVAGLDDTPLSIARRYNIPLQKILSYNDMLPNQDFLLEQYVFLQPKRVRSRGAYRFHIIEEGETMYSIAQLHGIRLKSLYRKNKMTDGQEPAEGQEVFLRGKRTKPPALNTKKRDPERWHKQVPVTRVGQKILEKLKPVTPTDEKEETTVAAIEKPASKTPVLISKPMPVNRPEIAPPDDPTVAEIAASESPPVATTSAPLTSTPAANTTAKPLPEEFLPPAGNSSVAMEAEKTIQESQFITPTVTMPNLEIAASVDAPPAPDFNGKNYAPVTRPASPPVTRPEPVTSARPPSRPYTPIGTHEVVKGDTLWNIARRYATSVTELKILNGMASNTIKVGERLKIK